MKKRFLTGALILMTAAALAGCGSKEKKDADNPAENVEKAEDVTYDALFESNKGSRLLEKYDSVQYVYTTGTGESEQSENWALWKEGEDYVITQNSTVGESMVYKNGSCYYEDASDPENVLHSMGWFMDGVYEEYVKSLADEFLINNKSDEDFDSVEEEGNQYVILSSVGSQGDSSYFYRYTVDKETLEIQKFEAIIKTANGENKEADEQIVAQGIVSYNAECQIPAYVTELENAEKSRTIKITIDPSLDTEKVVEVKLPANVTLLALMKDSYGLYKDTNENANSEFDDAETPQNSDGSYKDVEVYCISDDSGEIAE